MPLPSGTICGSLIRRWCRYPTFRSHAGLEAHHRFTATSRVRDQHLDHAIWRGFSTRDRNLHAMWPRDAIRRCSVSSGRDALVLPPAEGRTG